MLAAALRDRQQDPAPPVHFHPTLSSGFLTGAMLAGARRGQRPGKGFPVLSQV